jgi:hypothetical protein
MSRELWAALAATAVVLVAVILGFRVLGGPGTQRLIQSDLRTVRDLAGLAQQINSKWRGPEKALPANLDQFPPSSKQDSLTHQPFLYHPKSGSAYELCATFAADSSHLPSQNAKDDWAHPKGNYCFQLDASLQVPQVPYYY